MFVDYIQNGAGVGEIAQALQGVRFDPGYMRPFFDDNGVPSVLINSGKKKQNAKGELEPIFNKVRIADIGQGMSPVLNATTLRKEEWIQFDNVVVMEARKRMRAWADLAASSRFGGFDGMSKMILEHETTDDPGEAFVDMDGLSEGRGAAPSYQLEGMPLPITHSGFSFSSRQIAASRNSGTPLDTTMAERATRRVVEAVEKTVIGVQTGITYGGNSTQVGGYGRTSAVYGYVNFPDRLTKTNLTAPTAGGWSPDDTVNEVLAMLDLLYDAGFYGPFMLYTSNDWSQYMNRDYALTGGNNPSQTLKQRLMAIDDITDVRRLDFLNSASNPFNLILVQMTSDVARAVDGMGIRTIQWESRGGMQRHFKVMCIYAPQIRATYAGACGICHGTLS